MAFGFPAYHTERYSPGPMAGDLMDAVYESLRALRWSIREDYDDEIIASTNVSLLSWGEKVEIRLSGRHSLSITSKCVLPTQCFDWGKNRANVNKFLDELESRI
ncbi:MAG: hypothetical protein KDA84_05600 [Planctomycetaceae bacterium]|nr:hypothetical protein [Planctomycetaceae bacterium]